MLPEIQLHLRDRLTVRSVRFIRLPHRSPPAASGDCEGFAFAGGELIAKALPEIDYAEALPLALGGVAAHGSIRDQNLQ
jgi:hypothetical protein